MLRRCTRSCEASRRWLRKGSAENLLDQKGVAYCGAQLGRRLPAGSDTTISCPVAIKLSLQLCRFVVGKLEVDICFSYAVIFAFFTALCFFFVSILLYRYKGQLIFMPMLGALMGYVAASVTLRRRKLGLSATMGEMK